jgi:AcrR family transcriptional regulator
LSPPLESVSNAAPERRRAVDSAARQARSVSILRATEQLLLDNHDRLPSVDEIAAAAGLAKGTVYLYYQSKEHILLALHEAYTSAFFDALIARLEGSGVMSVKTLVEFAGANLLRNPLYMRLAIVCHAAIQHDLPDVVVEQHATFVGAALRRAGTLLERRFAALRRGEGARMLHASYGLTLGLWQLYRPNARTLACGMAALGREVNFATEVQYALDAMWRGRLTAAPNKRSKS